MNRIDTTFASLRKQQKSAFIGFLCAGDPTLEDTYQCILEMDKNGCDLIEIGIPFSDPCAEGPVIQEASARALQNQYTTDDIMQMVKEVRQTTQVPLVYLLYYNQIYKYDCEAFIKACADCGIDGLIIPDLPYEHQEELEPIAKRFGIYLISLVTPISAKRKRMVSQHAKGFLYCVTSTGVTGMRDHFETDLSSFIKELDTYSDIPKALGFGISNAQQIKQLYGYADGIIVGSAIVNEIAKLSTQKTTLQDIGVFIKELADACHTTPNGRNP